MPTPLTGCRFDETTAGNSIEIDRGSSAGGHMSGLTLTLRAVAFDGDGEEPERFLFDGDWQRQ